MAEDFVSFFTNFCSFTNLKGWDPSKMLTRVGRKCGRVFRFIDDLNPVNDEIWKPLQWNIPICAYFKKQKYFTRGDNFPRPDLYINEDKIETTLYYKKKSCNFRIKIFLYKSSTIPSKIFFTTISAEIL